MDFFVWQGSRRRHSLDNGKDKQHGLKAWHAGKDAVLCSRISGSQQYGERHRLVGQPRLGKNEERHREFPDGDCPRKEYLDSIKSNYIVPAHNDPMASCEA